MTLLELLQLLRKHLALVIVLPIVCAVAMGAVSYGLMADEYTAQTTLYVLSKNSDDTTSSLQSSLNAGQLVANDVVALIESNRVVEDTAEDLGLESIAGYSVSVSSETNNRVITVSVTGEDPERAADIANGMADNVSSVATEVMDVEAVNVVDVAKTPTSPSGPNRVLYIAVAFLAGLFVAVAAVVLIDMLNTKVRSVEDVEELLGVPVIGRIPTVKEVR